MAKLMGLPSLLYSLLLSAFCIHCHGSSIEKKVHIVYMGEKPQADFSAKTTHHSILQNVLGSVSSAKEALVYSYGRSFNGFAARLSDHDVQKLSEMAGVISVIPNHIFKIHTTRSWDFMGFTQDKLSAPQQGDVVIGLLDTGVWPESQSFNDTGMGPPPPKWKGICQGEANFTCNNKIIGARYYNSADYYSDTDFKSPRDSEGHGTHTASTAAGAEVQGASYFGLAEGTARGAVPFGRIAVYKVCWSFGCSVADIFAAFDDAIADGVDILSVSLGAPFAFPYLHDPIAIGSYHAMKFGILTSCSAGNFGPSPYTASNVAPWTLTVAASTIDRKFVATAVLGNGKIISGVSINNFMMNGTYPLIWGGDAANYSAGADPDVAKFCIEGSLNSYIAAGKIVFCETLWDGSGVLLANGVGTIMADVEYSNDFAFSYPLPTTVISVEDGQQVLNYITSSENPTATILVSDPWNDITAPSVVSFSSRGPNMISPDILKPDLTAPGVDILAAWSPVSPPSIYYGDSRSVNFNIISGTSMSCPHASGAAAYVKAAHPDWSPAAVKSALMTTATILDPRKHRDLEFAYGSGQINPIAAADPGLVYDASEADYINFLCKQGYNTTTLKLITGDNSSVCNSTTPGRAWDLNYPSFSLAVEDGQPIGGGAFTRTVTNVGLPNSTYSLSLYFPSFISVTVEPSVLWFSAVGDKMTFKVTVSGPKIAQQPIVSGAIVWRSGTYVVRSPVVVYNILPGATYSVAHNLNKTPFKLKGSSVHHKNGILGHH